MDIFENALSDGADADAKLEAELANDTDAVVSVIYQEQAKIGRMLSTAEGAPSPLFRGMQLVTVAAAVGFAAIMPDGVPDPWTQPKKRGWVLPGPCGISERIASSTNSPAAPPGGSGSSSRAFSASGTGVHTLPSRACSILSMA